MKIKILSSKIISSKIDTILKIDKTQFKGKESWGKENFLKTLPSKFQLSLWAEKEGGELVGFLIASKKGKTGHLHRIAVNPSSTKQGVGSAMLAEFERICQKEKIFKIDAETFKNGSIRIFYLKNGFKLMSTTEQKKYALKKEPARRGDFLKESIVFEKNLKKEPKKKIVAIHQPNFMPWLGFFNKIAQADIYIVLDDVQYEKNDVINRNKIKTSNGSIWLTVPVKAHISEKINETKIDNSRDWQETHLKSLFYNYKKSNNFDLIYPKIEKIYAKNFGKIADLNMALIKEIMALLDIKTKIVYSSKLAVSGQKNELLINLIKSAKGTHYLSGLGGSKKYLDLKLFKKNGLEIIWSKYQPLKYQQLWGEFVPNLSAIDYLFCADKNQWNKFKNA